MMARKLIWIALLMATLPALAQNTMTVSSANITDLSGAQLAAGQACFLATDNQGIPLSAKAGGGGQYMKVA